MSTVSNDTLIERCTVAASGYFTAEGFNTLGILLQYIAKPLTEGFGSIRKANPAVSVCEFLNAAPLQRLDDAASPRYLRIPFLKTNSTPRVSL